jgi:hypothetical protein
MNKLLFFTTDWTPLIGWYPGKDFAEGTQARKNLNEDKWAADIQIYDTFEEAVKNAQLFRNKQFFFF